ncbi:MAG: hypothetical protein R2764_16570 [Bacteroidales bacterium]
MIRHLLQINQSHTYNSLDEAKQIISQVGQEIIENGLPAEISPLIIGFTGYGNVSNGAQKLQPYYPLRIFLRENC